MPALERLRERDKDMKSCKLRVEKRTNQHREPDGGLWGWYEVHPLGIVVGYWRPGQDDLRGVDLDEWNQCAEAISMANVKDRAPAEVRSPASALPPVPSSAIRPSKVGQGVLLAARWLVENGQPSVAANMLRDHGLDKCDLRKMEEQDIEVLAKLNIIEGTHFILPNAQDEARADSGSSPHQKEPNRMETSTLNAPPCCERLIRHCCGECIYHAVASDTGWGRFASPANPRRTDWCAVCGGRAEGVKMAVHRYKWGGFRIFPNYNA